MKAVILDTGCANLASLAFAVKRLGVEPLITREAADIRSADRIFLPGVGTAKAAMTALTERGLPELIREAHQPLLGICLGEQLLGRRSEETGGVDLLGLIDADVRQLNAPGLPLPHMGWNRVFPKFESPQAKLLLRTSNLENGSILSTALQCLTALPPLLPAHTESRLPPPLPAKTSWACSSTQSARAKRALVFSLISLEPPHDYSCH